jgi:hypothetical protein
MADGTSFFVIGGNVLVVGLVVYCAVRFVLFLFITRRGPRLATPQRSVRSAPQHRLSQTMGTPAEKLQSMSHNLTAVDRSEINPGETCAICLGELRLDVERTGRKEDVAAVAAPVKTGTEEGQVVNAEPVVVNAEPVVISPQPDPANAASESRGVRSAENSPNARSAEDARGSSSAQNSRGARSPEAPSHDDVVARGPALQSLRCGHCFHGECIRGWIVHRGAGASCPLCKRELAVRSSANAQGDVADRV